MSTTSIRVNSKILEELRHLLPCKRGALGKFIEYSLRETLERVRKGEITLEEILEYNKSI